MPKIYSIIAVALLSAFIILVLTKTGLRDELIDACCFSRNKKLRKVGEMLQCDLCFSFWMSVVICIILFVITFDLSMLAIPFLSTPITRFIL